LYPGASGSTNLRADGLYPGASSGSTNPLADGALGAANWLFGAAVPAGVEAQTGFLLY
jgi:hypothetical protein